MSKGQAKATKMNYPIERPPDARCLYIPTAKQCRENFANPKLPPEPELRDFQTR